MRRLALLLALFACRGPARAADDQGMADALTRLVAAEAAFHAAQHRYADRAELRDSAGALSWSGVAIIADSTRYVALATSSTSRMQCIVWAGSPRPATAGDAPPGVPTCWTP